MVGYSAAMTTTLLLETSSEYCSVALAGNGRIYENHRHLEKRHSERLLGMIDDVMHQAGLGAADIDVVGFGCGPGSFTGVRIAAATVQAIALAAQAPVVGVPSADVIYMNSGLAPADALVAIRSRGDAYYLAWYVDGKARREAALYTSSPDWLDDLAMRTPLIGPQPPWLRLEVPRIDAEPRAVAMLDTVIEVFRAGGC